MEAETVVMFQGVAKASAAFRLMQQMGWEEGHGLGKHNQGMKEHLRVKNKQNTEGIGIDQKMKAQANWALNTMAYDSILQKLKVVAVPAMKDVKEEDDSDGGADDEVEAKREEEEKQKVLKVTRPQGRYKKREQGKMVGAYSKTDLAAILGGSAQKTVKEISTQNYQANKAMCENSIIIVEESSPRVKKTLSKIVEDHPTQVFKKTSKSKVKENNKLEDAVKVAPSLPDLPDDWWGNKYGFIRAGLMGAASGVLKTERTSFHEKDQEDLYKLTQDKATTGKKGLGIGEHKMGLCIGNGKPMNKKKVWDSDNDEEELGEEMAHTDSKVVSTPVECEERKVKKKSKRNDTLRKDEPSTPEAMGKSVSKKRRKVIKAQEDP